MQARTPWKLRVSTRPAGGRGERDPETQTRAIGFGRRHAVERVRGRRRRRSPSNCGRDALRRGIRPGPGPDPRTTGRATKGAQGSDVAMLSTSCSSERGVREPRRLTGPVRGGNAARRVFRTSLRAANPMDGSGPRETAKRRGEQTVEEVRNLEDGTSRGVRSPGDADPHRPRRRRGAKPQEGNPGRQGLGRQRSASPERGPSLWELSVRAGPQGPEHAPQGG